MGAYGSKRLRQQRWALDSHRYSDLRDFRWLYTIVPVHRKNNEGQFQLEYRISQFQFFFLWDVLYQLYAITGSHIQSHPITCNHVQSHPSTSNHRPASSTLSMHCHILSSFLDFVDIRVNLRGLKEFKLSWFISTRHARDWLWELRILSYMTRERKRDEREREKEERERGRERQDSERESHSEEFLFTEPENRRVIYISL